MAGLPPRRGDLAQALQRRLCRRARGAAYNFTVPGLPKPLLTDAVVARALLFANHVLMAEPAAVARLMPHAGRRLQLQWDAPAGAWPRPPEVALRITPAGLLDRLEGEAAALDLRVRVVLPAPLDFALRWLAGERPQVQVEGDARLAADIAWLAEHLRWDAEHDLGRLVGDAWAHELMRIGRGLREALAALAQRGLAQRPGGGATAAP